MEETIKQVIVRGIRDDWASFVREQEARVTDPWFDQIQVTLYEKTLYAREAFEQLINCYLLDTPFESHGARIIVTDALILSSLEGHKLSITAQVDVWVAEKDRS